MKLSDFDYTYPRELIATHPPASRDASRLMVLNRKERTWEHRRFADILGYIDEGDVLVVNDSKVLPCRLLIPQPSGKPVECLLLKEQSPRIWECLLFPFAKTQPGTVLRFSEGLEGRVLEGGSERSRLIELRYDGDLSGHLEKIGHVPLPPYIKRDDQPELDRTRYQTIYAAQAGSAAAPTAGFHFTPEILAKLKAKGVAVVSVTLHVGLGTFLPIRSDEIEEHRMHTEHYRIPPESARVIRAAKREGRAVCAVGTTSVRALESAALGPGELREGEGATSKFIYPPYAFNIVDRMITNFHQPKSTLLTLVSAFAGREFILDAYAEAIRERYRLFSYGDCMLIV